MMSSELNAGGAADDDAENAENAEEDEEEEAEDDEGDAECDGNAKQGDS